MSVEPRRCPSCDRNVCSFWADATLARKLGLPEGEVIQARYALVARGFIAYRFPLYQLLPLDGGPQA